MYIQEYEIGKSGQNYVEIILIKRNMLYFAKKMTLYCTHQVKVNYAQSQYAL